MQASAEQSSQAGAALLGGLGLAVILFLLVLAVVVFLVFAYFYKRICKNCGHEPGVLIWIPIVQFIPIVQAAGLPVWMFILTLVPFVNYFFFIYLDTGS